jgi:hypothetical protein
MGWPPAVKNAKDAQPITWPPGFITCVQLIPSLGFFVTDPVELTVEPFASVPRTG